MYPLVQMIFRFRFHSSCLFFPITAILNENEAAEMPEAEEETAMGVGELTWIMGVVAGVVGLLLVIVALCDAIILSARRRRRQAANRNSGLEHSVATSGENCSLIVNVQT